MGYLKIAAESHGIRPTDGHPLFYFTTCASINLRRLLPSAIGGFNAQGETHAW
jgi:hypothetical protein